MADVGFGIAFIAGLLSFFSPCVLPLVPAYVGYMGGRMTHTLALQAQGKRGLLGEGAVQRANMLAHSLMFVSGFTLVFVSLGLATTALLSLLGSTAVLLTDVISRLGGLLIILFGLHFMGALRWLFRRLRAYPGIAGSPLFTLVAGAVVTGLLVWGFVEPVLALPFIAGWLLWLTLGGGLHAPAIFWNSVVDRVEALLYSDMRRSYTPHSGSAGLGGSFLMGVVFSAGWTPCIGPIYGTILTVAANTGDVAYATPLLLAYSLGLGLPFVLAAGLMGQAQGLLRRVQRHMRRLELITGGLLVLIGIMVASGQMTRLTQSLNTHFADISVRVEECGVGVFQGRLGASQVADCLNGQLHPRVLRQSSTVTLAAGGHHDFVYNLPAGSAIAVELSHFDAGFAPTVTVTTAAGQTLASSNAPPLATTDVYVALERVVIPQGGLVTIRVSNSAGRFRIRVVTAQAVAALDGVPALADLAAAVLPRAAVGRRAPDFTATTRSGETLSISALHGRVVVLNFWGTWCALCEREMPALQALYDAHRHNGLLVLGLAVRDTPAQVDAFLAERGLTFPVALDEDMALARLYAVTGQPTTFVIDRRGVIRQAFFSATSADALEPVIAEALAS